MVFYILKKKTSDCFFMYFNVPRTCSLYRTRITKFSSTAVAVAWTLETQLHVPKLHVHVDIRQPLSYGRKVYFIDFGAKAIYIA